MMTTTLRKGREFAAGTFEEAAVLMLHGLPLVDVRPDGDAGRMSLVFADDPPGKARMALAQHASGRFTTSSLALFGALKATKDAVFGARRKRGYE